MFVCSDLREVFWPRIIYRDEEAEERYYRERGQLQKNVSDIDLTDSSREYMLEEALRQYNDELDRSDKVERKAFNLLVFSGALVPFIGFVADFMLSSPENLYSPPWLLVVFLLLSLVYWSRTIYLLLNCVDVSGYEKVTPQDYNEITIGNSSFENLLVKKYLEYTVNNQEVTNELVDSYGLGLDFLLRTLYTIAAVIVFECVFYLYYSYIHYPLLSSHFF